MKPIILADPLPQMFLDLSNDALDIRPLDSTSPDDLQSAVGIVTYAHPTIDGAFLDRCPQVRVVSNHGVGVDHIDVAAATQRNVAVGNTPGCLDASTADMTMALILSVARNVVTGDHFARGPEFTHYDPSLLIGQEVTGSTLGIIGLGRIGAEVAKRAAAFGMTLLYHNRNRRPELESSIGIRYASLPELLSESDFVSLNCPLTPETTGLIGTQQLSRMKRSGILINMARGPVVRTDDLYTALTDGTIAAAGLDVTDPEPLPRNHPLLNLKNVIITPHLGSASNRTRQRMIEITITNLHAGINSEPLMHQVNSDR
ncbi:MAG: D-glycerate dehydrogenase [Planctomycetaceae bacterium]|nr:D-glycerate dehydrogenase [Planctomycetaceae bacterium]